MHWLCKLQGMINLITTVVVMMVAMVMTMITMKSMTMMTMIMMTMMTMPTMVFIRWGSGGERSVLCGAAQAELLLQRGNCR